MKTLSCNQLGGPKSCEVKFHAETFEEIAEQSKQHGMEKFQEGDAEHLEAMNAMKEKMQSESDFQAWIAEKQKLFNETPEDTQ